MTNLKLAAAMALAVVAGGMTAAHAGPISLYYSFDGTNFTQLGTTTTNGVNGISGATVTNGGTSFVISMNATGTNDSTGLPLPQPNFATTTVDVNTTGSGTLYLAAIETSLTNTNVGSFTLGFTNNGNSTVSATESFAAGSSLSPTSSALDSVTLSPNSAVHPMVSAPTLTSPYSVEAMYAATFGSTGGLLDATIAESATVPEPVSLSLLGAGLAGLGMLNLRRKRG